MSVILHFDGPENDNCDKSQNDHGVGEHVSRSEYLNFSNVAQKSEKKEEEEGKPISLNVNVPGMLEYVAEVNHDEIDIGTYEADLRQTQSQIDH